MCPARTAAYGWIERRYCPTSDVTRREMAVFVIRGWR